MAWYNLVAIINAVFFILAFAYLRRLAKKNKASENSVLLIIYWSIALILFLIMTNFYTLLGGIYWW